MAENLQLYIFATVALTIVVFTLWSLSKMRCLRKRLTSMLEGVRDSMIWNGLIASVQFSYFNLCIMAYATFVVAMESNDTATYAQGYVLIGLLTLYPIIIARIIYTNGDNLRSRAF